MEKALALIKKRNTAVLATCSGDVPTTSLMIYYFDEAKQRIIMLTMRGSLKEINIVENPRVSVLIDSREDSPGEFGSVAALTLSCKPELVEAEEEFEH